VSLCRCGVESFGLSGCYWCLKVTGMNGGFGRLTEDEIVFAGLAPSPRPRDGWRSAGERARGLDPEPDVDLERTAMLHWLASLGDMDELPSV
jgi:hypothetical protein